MSWFRRFRTFVDKDEKPVSDDFVIPIVEFDASLVTQSVEEDLQQSLLQIPDFKSHIIQKLYPIALQSVRKGRAIHILFNAILDLRLNNVSKSRAVEVSIFLHSRTTAFINNERTISLGITHAIWRYSEAPCCTNPKNMDDHFKRQNAAHQIADNTRFDVKQGLEVNGIVTWPGREMGCKCASLPIVKGLSF